MADELEQTRQEIKYREELAKLDKDSENYLDNVIKLNRIYATQREQVLDIEKQIADLSGTQLDKAKEVNDLAQRETLALIRRINAGKEVNADLDQQLEKLQQIRDEQDRIRAAQSASKALSGDIASRLGLARDAQSGFLRSAVSGGKPIQGLMQNAQQLGANLKNTFTAANIGVSAASALMKQFVNITKDAVIQADKLRSEFVAVTGDAGDTRDAFINLTLANTELAIGFKEMMGAQMALREGFVDFVFLSGDVQNSLTLQAATMEKLGIDTTTTSETINTLTQSFGMNHAEAMQTQRDMVGLGKALGIPPKVIAQEFSKAMPALAEFGREATQVFERLVTASRETGLSIDALTGTFGDAMNTYEGSTRAAGQLNAVLGQGMVSGTQLLVADTEERLRIVQDALRLTGRTFSDLARFEKITIAQAAGFRSVDDAARAFGNTQEDLATKIGDTTVTQAEMEELAKQATDSFTQLKFAMMSFAVAIKPITEGFAIMVDKFVEFGSGFPGGTAGLITAITAVGGLAVGAAGLLGLGTTAIAGGGIALGAAALGGTALAMAPGVDDGSLTFEAASGEMTRVPIHSQDTAQVMLSKPGGPMERAAPTVAAAATPTTNTNIVVKVMLNERELGEAIVPMIDRRVLGTP